MRSAFATFGCSHNLCAGELLRSASSHFRVVKEEADMNDSESALCNIYAIQGVLKGFLAQRQRRLRPGLAKQLHFCWAIFSHRKVLYKFGAIGR